MRLRNPTVSSIAEPRNTQKKPLIQASGPYHASQSGRNNQRVAITAVPYAMRNSAIGAGDCSTKKNLFHAVVKDFIINANPRASPHSRRGHAGPRVQSDISPVLLALSLTTPEPR